MSYLILYSAALHCNCPHYCAPHYNTCSPCTAVYALHDEYTTFVLHCTAQHFTSIYRKHTAIQVSYSGSTRPHLEAHGVAEGAETPKRAGGVLDRELIQSPLHHAQLFFGAFFRRFHVVSGMRADTTAAVTANGMQRQRRLQETTVTRIGGYSQRRLQPAEVAGHGGYRHF